MLIQIGGSIKCLSESSGLGHLVRSPVEATFLSGVFSPLTSAEACEKSSWWLWKERLCQYWCEKASKQICVTGRHDMTLAVKVALNPNTTNQHTNWVSWGTAWTICVGLGGIKAASSCGCD